MERVSLHSFAKELVTGDSYLFFYRIGKGKRLLFAEKVIREEPYHFFDQNCKGLDFTFCGSVKRDPYPLTANALPF